MLPRIKFVQFGSGFGLAKNTFFFEISVKKVVVVIGDPLSAIFLRDQAFISDAVRRLLEGRGKGLAVWLKGNVMSLEPDALAEMITA